MFYLLELVKYDKTVAALVDGHEYLFDGVSRLPQQDVLRTPARHLLHPGEGVVGHISDPLRE